MARREYAIPTPYWEQAATNAADVPALRQQLAEAEKTEARATTWVARARAHEDAKQIRRQIDGARTDRRAETATHAAKSRQGGARFARPRSYFEEPKHEPPVATNSLASLSFAAQHELIQAAMAELRRVGAVK